MTKATIEEIILSGGNYFPASPANTIYNHEKNLCNAIIRFINGKQIGTEEERKELIEFIWNNFNDEEGVE